MSVGQDDIRVLGTGSRAGQMGVPFGRDGRGPHATTYGVRSLGLANGLHYLKRPWLQHRLSWAVGIAGH